MTYYKLHDGTEAPAYTGGAEHFDGRLWVVHPALGLISIADNTLTEVVPPLPAEPPVGTVLRDDEGDVWQRQTDGWRTCGSYEKHDWATLSKYPLTRLVPDPAADAGSYARDDRGAETE